MSKENLHFSYNTFDETIIECLRIIKPSRILDIGSGDGKYGKIIRAANLSPKPLVRALEAVEACREDLEKLYDEVVIDVPDSLYETKETNFDVVILGDVIEHFRKSDGLDLLEFLTYRSAYIIIATPECMVQNIPGNFYASHNSIWRPEAFGWHDRWAHANTRTMHLYILRGYLNWQGANLNDIVNQINAKNIVAPSPNSTLVKHTKLQLHSDILKEPADDGDGFIQFRPS